MTSNRLIAETNATAASEEHRRGCDDAHELALAADRDGFLSALVTSDHASCLGAYGAGTLFAQWRAGPLQDRPDTVALCCEVENL